MWMYPWAYMVVVVVVVGFMHFPWELLALDSWVLDSWLEGKP